MKKLSLSTWEIFRDNKNWETLSFLGHRISGIALTLYIVLHIFVVSPIFTVGGSFDERMAKLHSFPGYPVIEVLLFAAVIAHMLNGIRLMLGDFLGLTKEQKNIFWIIAFVGFVTVAIGGIVMYANFLNLPH